MAKRSKRKLRGRPQARPGGTPKDRDAAELQAHLLRQRKRVDPAGVLSAMQPNPPRVIGKASAAAERQILED